MDVFKIINYAYDEKGLRIIILVDDGNENLQLYTGDVSEFFQHIDSDIINIKWVKFGQDTLIKASDLKTEGLTGGMRYVNDKLYIKDAFHQNIVIYSKTTMKKDISLINFYDGLQQEKNEKENFYVSDDGKLYYGAKDGLYRYNGSTWIRVYPTKSYPTIIKANKDIVVMVVHDNRDSIFIAHKNQGLDGKWDGHYLKTPGQVFDVLFNDDWKMCFLLTKTPSNPTGTVFNLFYYDITGDSLQITWADSIYEPRFTTQFNGQASGEFAIAIPTEFGNGTTVINSYIQDGAKLVVNELSVDNGSGTVAYFDQQAEASVDDETITNLSKATLSKPQVAIYLHNTGELYFSYEAGGYIMKKVTNSF